MNDSPLPRVRRRVMPCGQLFLLLMFSLSCLPALAGTAALAYEEQTLLVEGESRTVRVPKGYRLEWLSRMEKPRMLTFAANGDLFAGSKSGKVYRLPPPYTKPEVLVELGGYPHSVAFRQGEILIARTDGVYRAAYRPGQSSIEPDALSCWRRCPAAAGMTAARWGWVRTGGCMRAWAFSTIAASSFWARVISLHEQRGGVLVLRERGAKAGWETFASGLRNPVGFDWQPQTGVLFAGNNGPDHLGFDQPPEYFSRLMRVLFTACRGSSLTANSCSAMIRAEPTATPAQRRDAAGRHFPLAQCAAGHGFCAQGRAGCRAGI